MTDIAELESSNLARIDGAADLASLDEARVAILGKSGNVTLLARTLGSVSLEERKVLGPQINQMRDRLARRRKYGPARSPCFPPTRPRWGGGAIRFPVQGRVS